MGGIVIVGALVGFVGAAIDRRHIAIIRAAESRSSGGTNALDLRAAMLPYEGSQVVTHVALRRSGQLDPARCRMCERRRPDDGRTRGADLNVVERAAADRDSDHHECTRHGVTLSVNGPTIVATVPVELDGVMLSAGTGSVTGLAATPRRSVEVKLAMHRVALGAQRVLAAISICPAAATTGPSGGQQDCPVTDSSLRCVVGERARRTQEQSFPDGVAWAGSHGRKPRS